MRWGGGDQHRDLADALHACKATVILSGYDSSLYEELFGDWHQVRISAITQNASDASRVEVIWSNRPLVEDTPLFSLEATA